MGPQMESGRAVHGSPHASMGDSRRGSACGCGRGHSSHAGASELRPSVAASWATAAGTVTVEHLAVSKDSALPPVRHREALLIEPIGDTSGGAPARAGERASTGSSRGTGAAEARALRRPLPGTATRHWSTLDGSSRHGSRPVAHAYECGSSPLPIIWGGTNAFCGRPLGFRALGAVTHVLEAHPRIPLRAVPETPRHNLAAWYAWWLGAGPSPSFHTLRSATPVDLCQRRHRSCHDPAPLHQLVVENGVRRQDHSADSSPWRPASTPEAS